MFRVVALLLALLLPLQFAWGAAAPYCGHEQAGMETSVADPSPHFGHHAHVHLAQDGKPAGAKLAVDNDCSACHAAVPAIVSQAVADLAAPANGRRAVLPPPAPLSSALARAPDRPQWPSLA